MCQNLYFYLFFARCTFSSYFCIGVFSHFFQVMFFQVLCFIFAGSLALLLFVFIRSLRSCGIAASSCRQHLQLQTMRHCRSGIAASSYSGIAASIYSGRSCDIAAAALPPAFIAALPPAFTAALPPACIHIAALPPVCSCSVHSQRHCRQHTFLAALPPESIPA